MEKNPNRQSMMGFAGPNSEFFVHFDKYFDHPAITHLTYNYRSVNSIVEIGNDIIKQNKGLQIDKKVESYDENK